jgi:amidohydrolase
MLDIIQIRHQLHAHPEVSNQEIWTSAFVVEQLKKMGVTKIHTHFAQHSILAEIDGLEAGKTLLFRCELDALPIQEANNFAHKSLIEGVSHKCGHDGHMATMLAFAQKLMQNPPKSGKFLLLFQSAEEIGEGAKAVLNSGILSPFSIDYAYAYHNLPSFPLGAIVYKFGTITPSVESFSIELKGKKCHASKPADGINPAKAVAQFIRFMARFHQPDKSWDGYFVVTPIHINMGEKTYGISAGYAEIGYTIRTFKQDDLNKIKQRIIKKIKAICKAENLEYSICWFEAFNANINHSEAIEHLDIVAMNNDFNVIEIDEPLDFGEDFGLFTEGYKGALFGIGSGENCPALHTVDYDFPDELIDVGSRLFYELCQ